MYYLVKNNMPRETVRRRNKNVRFPVKESEYIPTEQECFIGQIDMRDDYDKDIVSNQ